jgi:hypothetical protein
MEEIWKPIKEFENKYEISNLGRIRNIRTNHILKMTNQYGDYFSIILYDGEYKKSTRIHRLVAEAFIPNPNNYKYVNHKDMNKQNNCVDNLEWCTQSYNTKHAIENGANTMSGFNRYNKNKAYKKYGYIYQYNKNMEFIDKHYSPLEAHKKTGVCARNISQCINHQGGRKQAGGYIWLKESEAIKFGVKI